MVAPQFIVFDLDSTLAECSGVFAGARAAFADLCIGLVPGAQRAEVIDSLNDESRQAWAEFGVSPQRMPIAMERAYRRLASARGLNVDPIACAEVRAIGAAIYEAPYPAFPETVDTLRHFIQSGHRLGLLTRGDLAIQQRKIDRNQLGSWFSAIHIVAEKTPATLEALLRELGWVPGTPAAMVGDSRRDDIAPARTLGLTTVIVRRDRARFPEIYEEIDARGPEPILADYAVEHVGELPSIFHGVR